MAKEYFELKNQRIEFDTEAFTMTVTMNDETFTNISIHRMNENLFNGTYMMFKAEMYKGLANAENPSVVAMMSEQDRIRLEHIPSVSDVDKFNEIKNQALEYFQNNLQ
jgi:hypothetical protein